MTRRLTAPLAWAIALLTVLADSPARASQILPQPVEFMTLRAQLVVRCMPIPATQVTVLDEGLILTQMQFDVLEVLQGSPDPGPVTVEVLGGTDGVETMTMVNGAKFVEGEEVVLFLWRETSVAPYQMLDHAAGKFEIHTDGVDTVLTRRDFGEFDANAPMMPFAEPPTSYDELVERIRSTDGIRAEIQIQHRLPTPADAFRAAVKRAEDKAASPPGQSASSTPPISPTSEEPKP